MLATIFPDAGKSMVAQALANRQPRETGNVVFAGYGLRGTPFPPMPPLAPPPIPMPAIPDWLMAAWGMLQLNRRTLSDLAGGGDDGKKRCLDRWEREYNRCDRFWLPSTNRYTKACQARADDRLSLCYGNGGMPDPQEPAEYDWRDIPRDPAGR